MLAISINICAAPREAKAKIPNNSMIPNVEITIDGKTTTVKPTELSVKENDEKSIICTIFGTKNSKAVVKLPISYSKAMDIALRVAQIARDCGLISNKQFDEYIELYKAQCK